MTSRSCFAPIFSFFHSWTTHLLFILFFCSISPQAHAMGNGVWIGVSPTFNLSQDSALIVQSEYRIQNNVEQTLFRNTWLYALHTDWKLGSGFDIFSGSNFETRIWQEINYRHQWDAITPFVRVREEVRRAQGMEDTRFRTRAMVGLSYRNNPSALLSFTIYDECFGLQTTLEGPLAMYDRNWLGGRMSVHTPKGTIHLGAMLETVNQGDTSLIEQLSFQGKFR